MSFSAVATPDLHSYIAYGKLLTKVPIFSIASLTWVISWILRSLIASSKIFASVSKSTKHFSNASNPVS